MHCLRMLSMQLVPGDHEIREELELPNLKGSIQEKKNNSMLTSINSSFTPKTADISIHTLQFTTIR